MKGYLESYVLRMQHNHNAVIEFAKLFLKAGYVIRMWKNPNRYYSSFTLYTDNTFTKGVRLQFSEVPYRWQLEYDLDYRHGHGSGYTGAQRHVNDYEIPFTYDEIIERIKPMFYDKRFASFHQYITEISDLPEKIEIKED